ncbi:MAG TPA: GNAT family N-acetyltransferase [Thermoanaerobaculia bacterium]|nr:GNAT family N-acetyltransferase [Thermoanaerobaculia bacterium]
MVHDSYPHCDISLARRLERCEAKTNAAFVEARARLAPAAGAAWLEHAGAYAMFDGPDSPLTQTFGFGVFHEANGDDLARLEAFLVERGAEPFHEVSPLAGNDALAVLGARGYRPVELTSVMFRPLPASFPEAATRVGARIAASGEEELWGNVAAEGWSEQPELIAFIRDLGRVSANSEGTAPFFAELDGQLIATGAVATHDGVALLAGASTIPSARNQGAQRALLEARLRHATAAGCDLAMMCAAPGSTSQRNAERQGFRIAYTRIKWGRPAIS